MTFADTLWRNAITARSTMITAANYSAAFYGNAAVQGWHLGMTAPLTFWQTMARTVASPANAEATDNVVEMLRDIASEPVAAMAEVAEMVSAEAATDPAPVAEAPAAPVEAAPAEPAPAEAAPNPALLDAPRGGKPDDLTALRGIGAKLAGSLNEIGIYHVDQIAALDAEGIDWLDENIPGFKLACTRFDIVAGAAKRA
jgi:predicted flap endonuclease-1-like 5' DNA nuclease